MDLDFILQISREVGFGGGSECVAFELHRAWLAEGLDTRIVTSNATEPDGKPGISIVASWLNLLFSGSRLRHLAALFTIPLFTLIASWHVLRDRGEKMVLSHGDSLIGGVCVVHSVNKACLAEKRRGGYYAWAFNPLNLWVALRDRWMFGGRRYRRLVAISERVRQELKEYYDVPDDQIVTIPNGINLARFNPDNAKARGEKRRLFGIPEQAPLILFVGSRFRIKGLKYAIEALAKMQTKAFLLVVGDDSVAPYKQLAEELGVSERVCLCRKPQRSAADLSSGRRVCLALAASNLTGFLAGYRFVKRIPGGNDDDHILVFQKDADTRIAAWTSAKREHEVFIPLGTGLFSIKEYSGKRVDVLNSNQDGANVKLSNAPLFIKKIH